MSGNSDVKEMLEEQSADEFAIASAAASSGDPIGMIEALYKNHALDGITRLMRAKWRAIPDDEVDFIIANAVDVLYREVREGSKILNIGGYLYKVSNLKAHQYHANRQREDAVVKDLEYRNAKTEQPQQLANVSDEDEGEELEYEDRRTRACALAKSLLPQLGQKNIQDVMRVIIEAVEAGRQDISSPEIADILGLSNVATVRQLRKRGFERLSRRAKSAGIIEGVVDLVSLDGEDG